MPKSKPEESLTQDGAAAIAWSVADALENLRGDHVADFVLLLRWLAYKADDSSRETIYVETEKAFAVNFEGVEEAITAHMRKRAEKCMRELTKAGASDEH